MELKLYVKMYCPFCQKVFREIERSGRTDIEMHDIIASQEDAKELVRVGGKNQVPCLFIDGEPLYESGDIVRWLQENPQH